MYSIWTVTALEWYSFKCCFNIRHLIKRVFFVGCAILRTILQNCVLVSQRAKTAQNNIVICLHWHVSKCFHPVVDRFERFKFILCNLLLLIFKFIIKLSQITPWCTFGCKSIHEMQTAAIFNVSDGSKRKLERMKSMLKPFRNYFSGSPYYILYLHITWGKTLRLSFRLKKICCALSKTAFVSDLNFTLTAMQQK